jgi:uncharacterized protein with PIN domain
VRRGDAPGEPRFIADAMLGRLARWLRLLGQDTLYEPGIADRELVRRALEEGRYILTRDRRLTEEWRVADVYVVSADTPREQLAETLARFDLAGRIRLFSRCSRCNAVVAPVSRDDAAGRVPADVLASGARIFTCRSCGRLYWEGSHTARMREVLADVLARAGYADASP